MLFSQQKSSYESVNYLLGIEKMFFLIMLTNNTAQIFVFFPLIVSILLIYFNVRYWILFKL